MGFRISTNTAALSAKRHLGIAQQQVERSLKALASGTRIVDARADAAGFAIAENLRGHIGGIKAAKNNAESAIGLIQVAEGGLNEQNNILIRLRELGVQAASDTVSEVERGFIDQEFQQLASEFDRIAKSTRFGSKALLTGSGEEFEFHLGSNSDEENIIRFTLDADTTAGNLEIEGLNIEDKGSARDSLDTIDSSLQKLAGVRSNFGAIQSRLQIASNNLDVQLENTEAARSRIADADIAQETSNLIRGQILSEFGTAVLAQANTDARRALKLIG